MNEHRGNSFRVNGCRNAGAVALAGKHHLSFRLCFPLSRVPIDIAIITAKQWIFKKIKPREEFFGWFPLNGTTVQQPKPALFQDAVAKKAVDALASLHGTKYRYGSIITTICKLVLQSGGGGGAAANFMEAAVRPKQQRLLLTQALLFCSPYNDSAV